MRKRSSDELTLECLRNSSSSSGSKTNPYSPERSALTWPTFLALSIPFFLAALPHNLTLSLGLQRVEMKASRCNTRAHKISEKAFNTNIRMKSFNNNRSNFEKWKLDKCPNLYCISKLSSEKA